MFTQNVVEGFVCFSFASPFLAILITAFIVNRQDKKMLKLLVIKLMEGALIIRLIYFLSFKVIH